MRLYRADNSFIIYPRNMTLIRTYNSIIFAYVSFFLLAAITAAQKRERKYFEQIRKIILLHFGTLVGPRRKGHDWTLIEDYDFQD